MPPNQELSIIERFREQHHAVARRFAIGQTPSMIRRQTGISMRRLELLWNDPSFQELIAIYTKRVEEEWDKNVDVYTDLGVRAMILSEALVVERVENSMEEGAEPIPLAMLDKISQGRADRFGYSKHSTIEHKHDFASVLDKAIERSGKAKEVKLIEGQALPPTVPSTKGPAPHGASPPVPVRSVEAKPRSFVSVLKKRKIG